MTNNHNNEDDNTTATTYSNDFEDTSDFQIECTNNMSNNYADDQDNDPEFPMSNSLIVLPSNTTCDDPIEDDNNNNEDIASRITNGDNNTMNNNCHDYYYDDYDIDDYYDDETDMNNSFCIGDHVYQWCSFIGIPGVFQHHGIVLDVSYNKGNTNNEDTTCEDEVMLTIADFSSLHDKERVKEYLYLRKKQNKQKQKQKQHDDKDNSNEQFTNEEKEQEQQDHNAYMIMAPTKKKALINFRTYSSKNNGAAKNGIRIYQDSGQKWKKVNYEADFWKRHIQRSGTCTSVTCDQPAIVLSRVYFLLEFPEALPKYNLLTSNCECVAVYCKTGQWGTLQASSFLSMYAAGQMKSTGTLAAYASTQQITVPCSGLWGYLGYTTKISLVAAQPYLLPAIATYGLITVGCPSLLLWKAQSFWNKISKQLTEQFWENAIQNPVIFANSMTYWSTKHNAYMASTKRRRLQAMKKNNNHTIEKNKALINNNQRKLLAITN